MQDNDGNTYLVKTENGVRLWTADDDEHAREQHVEAFPEEPILEVRFIKNGPHFFTSPTGKQ